MLLIFSSVVPGDYFVFIKPRKRQKTSHTDFKKPTGFTHIFRWKLTRIHFDGNSKQWSLLSTLLLTDRIIIFFSFYAKTLAIVITVHLFELCLPCQCSFFLFFFFFLPPLQCLNSISFFSFFPPFSFFFFPFLFETKTKQSKSNKSHTYFFFFEKLFIPPFYVDRRPTLEYLKCLSSPLALYTPPR